MRASGIPETQAGRFPDRAALPGIHPHHYDKEGLRALLARRVPGLSKVRLGKRDAWRATLRYSGDPERPPRGAFAGVKVYPPLGFDPWPEEAEDEGEREKLRMLLRLLRGKPHPLATHCDDQGYRTIPLEDSFRVTSPSRWASRSGTVFRGWRSVSPISSAVHPRAGAPSLGEWTREIVDLILERPGGLDRLLVRRRGNGVLHGLESRLNALDRISRERVERAILFGTDFPLCLMKTRSYSDYWRTFLEGPLTERRKRMFAVENGEAFLFGD